MELQRQSNAQIVTPDLSAPLGHGGEARIYALKQDETLAAKVYHQPGDAHAHKLMAMLANPPDNPMAEQGHISIAWPVDLLLTLEELLPSEVGSLEYMEGHQDALAFPQGRNARVVGFLMPRVQGMRPILDLYNPKTRRQRCPLFNYLYLHRTARNLAAAVRALHARGYCVGDVNESNILVSDSALVTLVDTDSFQVNDPHNGNIYRCPVGKPEFTPPELQGQSFANLDRTPQHDLFGLAVLIFQLLMEGTHPFSGIFQGAGDPPPYEARIAAGHFPYSQKQRVPYLPSFLAPPFEILHPQLRSLFVRCFDDGHHNPKLRPTAQNWQDALEEAEVTLVTCSANNQHRYGNHLKGCPWCDRTRALGGRDPFPSWQVVQHKQHLQPKPSKRVSRVTRSGGILPHPPTPTVPVQKPVLTKIGVNKRLIPLVLCLFVVGVYQIFKLLSNNKNLTVASDTNHRHSLTDARIASSGTPDEISLRGAVQPENAGYSLQAGTRDQGFQPPEKNCPEYCSSGTGSLARENQTAPQPKLREYQIAIEQSSLALRLNPNDVNAYINRGKARYNLAYYQEAIEDFKSALRLNPNQANAYINLGNTHYKLGNQSGDPDKEYKEAIKNFNQVLHLNPNDTEAYVKRGVVRYEMAQYSSNPAQDYKEAIEDFNLALRLNPQQAEAYVKRGLVRYKLAQSSGDFYKGYTEAVEDFNSALRLNPQQAEAYVKRGLIRYEMAQYSGKPDTESREAIEDLQKAANLFLEQGDMDNYQQALGNACVAQEKKCGPLLHNPK